MTEKKENKELILKDNLNSNSKNQLVIKSDQNTSNYNLYIIKKI